MTTRKCANPRFERGSRKVRSVRLSLSAQFGGFSRLSRDEKIAAELARERALGLADPMLALIAAVQVKAPGGVSGLSNDDYVCSVPGALVGIHVGDQVRVTRNASEYALYTVTKKRFLDNPNRVRMGEGARMRVGTNSDFAATLRLPVLAAGNLTDAEAQEASEFVERLVDDGQNKGLVIIAPHGGQIEFNTDREAEAATAALGCSSWICKGWRKGGGSYTRWHITSTKLSPRSFPGLGMIADRGFAHAISFHGMAASGVLIGGGGSLQVKMMLREAIKDALSDNSIEVMIARPGDKNSGFSPNNVVNWLTETGLTGIQLEQSPKVRQDHWEEMVEAVVSVYSQLL
jgi:phage replication-related protein YjqB (UPF0714/DUF867 family)